ncbi:hypothetical protein [Nocardia wallacei]|uniref:hypothetical protein n=1 Tax=Nocardia wallacei TaxID=480035 RepID=UPI002454B87A|nr:hypothetical protein [Nocardia wallacei]
MTAKSSYRSARASTGHASRTVPSTVWACGPHGIDPADRWPAAVLSRAVREFSAPGDRVLLIGWPAAARRGPLQAIPAGTGPALAAVEALGRRPRIESGTTGHADSHATAALVVVSLLADEDEGPGPGPVTDLAAQRVAEGGLLVVLSRCRHSRSGVLDDPAGAVVAAGQAADLLYLQHIIAAPVTGTTVVTPQPDAPARSAHVLAHTDVFVFLNPRSAEPC